MCTDSSTTSCSKTHAKVTIVAQNKDDDGVIKKASITLKPESGDGASFPSDGEGKANFFVKNGTYSATVTADNKTKGQTPARPFKDGEKTGITVAGEAQTIEVKLEPIPIVKVFLKLLFKDPDDNERAFLHPKVMMVFEDDSEQEVKFNEDGCLLGEDGTTPGLVLLKEKTSFRFKFTKPAKSTYNVCEERGADAVAKTTTVEDSGVAAKAKDLKRVFMLPNVEWTLDKAKWTIENDDSKWVATDHKFKDLNACGDTLGTTDAPVKMIVDMRWSFFRLLYFDRLKGGTDQISALPILVDGYAAKPAHAPTADKITTQSNWNFGSDDKAAIQCLPWILYDDTAKKPDKDSELRFKTKANTFIKTASDGKRTLVEGAQNTPCADRIAFYDLPAEWRSRNWFVRTKTKGTDITDGKFFWELDTMEKVLGEKTKPLMFSLDDIVLYKKDLATPVDPLDKKEAVAVFKHTFKKDGDSDLSEEGMYLPRSDLVKETGQNIVDVNYPASKKEVLGRKSNGDAHTELKENYVVKYPDWTRAIVAQGNVFDCFSYRSVAKDGEDRVVGARAGVRHVDVGGTFDNVGNWNTNTAKGTRKASPDFYFDPAPKPVAKPFFTIQPFAQTSTPVTNKRRDHASSKTKGSACTDPAVGPLQHSRMARDPERAKEWSADQTKGSSIGRWDVCLLRCCGKDDKKEKAILFQLFRLSTRFETSSTLNAAGQKTWMKTNTDNLIKRWNGPDGNYNKGRAVITPQTQPDDKPYEIEVLRFYQTVPDAIGAIRFQVIGNTGGRDFMNSYEGITQSSEGNEKPETSGRFTSGHEMGHGGGLLDDYCEIWNHASYYQPALPMLVPGDPYTMDDIEGSESMMLSNKELRNRHFWHLAEWLKPKLNTKLQVKYDGVEYFIPHHPRNAADTVDWRSFSMYPYDSILDVKLGIKKSRFDSYLFPLGKEGFSTKTLPKKCGPTATAFDAILIIAVHIGVDYLGNTDHDWIRGTTANINSHLRKKFGFRACAKVKIGTHQFERALIFISPRIIVGTHAGNDDYDKEIGALPQAFVNRKGYSEHSFVDGGDGFIYEVTYKSDPGPGSVWLAGNSAPVWPGVDGNTVDQGQIRWVCHTKPTGKLKSYQWVIRRKVEANQLHCVMQVGAATTEVKEQANKLPKLCIKSGDLSNLIKKVIKLGEEVKTVVLKVYQGLGPLKQEWVQARDDRDQLDLDITAKELAISNKQTEITTKQTEKGLLGPEDDGNRSEHTRLAGEITTKQQEKVTLEQEKVTLQTQRQQKADLYTDRRDRWDTLVGIWRPLMQATIIQNCYEKAKEMAAELFKDADDPMTDAGYTELGESKTAVATACTQPSPTRVSAIAAIKTTKTPGPKLKALALLLPQAETTTAQDVSKVVAAAVGIAEELKSFADAGSDKPKKYNLARQGKVAVEGVFDGAKKGREQYHTWWVSLPDWPAVKVDRHSTVLEQTVKGYRVYEEATKSGTLEEQLETTFATFLNLKTDPSKLDGYDALVKPLADEPDKVEVKSTVPPPPPIIIDVPPVVEPVRGPQPNEENATVVV